MRVGLVLWVFAGSWSAVWGQSARPDSTLWASSAWQYVQLQRHLVGASTVLAESFTTNQRGWQTGQVGNYTYELTDSSYRIRRSGPRSLVSARSFIQLPDSLNLNRAAAFVVDVDMLVPKGVLPESGLLLGVSDDANYTVLAVQGQTDCLFTRVVNGSVSSVNLSGRRAATEKSPWMNREQNHLRVEKHDGKLFVTINGQELPGGTAVFRPFRGNGIGFVSSAEAVTFKNLRVRVSR